MAKLSDKQFQKLVLDQRKQLEKLTDRLRNLPAKIVAGDLFALPVEQASELRWLFLSTTQNDSQTWIALPADNMELIGTRDVEVPDWAEDGPINIRCQNRIELPASELNVELQRVGHLSADYLKQVKEKIAEIDNAFEFLAPELLAVDKNPDYIAWMENVRGEAYRVERHLHIASGQSETTWLARIVEKGKELFQVIFEDLVEVLPFDPGPPVASMGPKMYASSFVCPSPIAIVWAPIAIVWDLVSELTGFFSSSAKKRSEDPEDMIEVVILGESSECILVALVAGRRLVALGAFGVLSSDPPTVHVVDDSGKRQLVRWQLQQPGIYLSDQAYEYQPDQILNWESDSI